MFLLSIYRLSGESLPVQGSIRLDNGDLSHGVYLGGEWIFENDRGERSIQSVPDLWNERYDTFKGKGAYELNLFVPRGEMVALYFPQLNMNIRVLLNGEVLYKTRIPGRTPHGYIPGSAVFKSAGNNLIRIELDNYFFRRGGLFRALRVGSPEVIYSYRARILIFQVFLSGIMFFLFLYSLYIFFHKYTDLSAFYLGLASLGFVLRGMITGEMPLSLLIPILPWSLFYRLEYILIYSGALFVALFLRRMFPPSKKKICRFFSLIIIVGVISIVATLFIPLFWVSHSVYWVQTYGLIVFIYGLVFIARHMIENDREALIIFIGGFFFLSLTVLDILNTHGAHFFPDLTQAGMVFFLLSQFLVLTRRFGESYLKAEKLSRELEKEVALQTEELVKLSRTDPLTGLLNRRRFWELGEREGEIHRRYGNPLTLMMLDLDNFKDINDLHGHAVGDCVLVFMSRLCQELIRTSDILGRLGGEEFALILRETGLEEAQTIAERIRWELETRSSHYREEIPPVTVSIGLVEYGEDETLAQALDRADKQLYRAKRDGRNRVAVG